MKVVLLFAVVLIAGITGVSAQTESASRSLWKPSPRRYQVKQAAEVESLVPMFFYGGFHYAAGYRYHKFRIRVSVINGGSYDAETAGINNNEANFKRFYKTSPGVFFGYNLWKNLELYTYLESHTFAIEQKSTGAKKNIHSTDTGLALSYQFFVGPYFYIQPGLHLYLRANGNLYFDQVKYNIPNADYSVVLRLGFRVWAKY